MMYRRCSPADRQWPNLLANHAHRSKATVCPQKTLIQHLSKRIVSVQSRPKIGFEQGWFDLRAAMNALSQGHLQAIQGLSLNFDRLPRGSETFCRKFAQTPEALAMLHTLLSQVSPSNQSDPELTGLLLRNAHGLALCKLFALSSADQQICLTPILKEHIDSHVEFKSLSMLRKFKCLEYLAENQNLASLLLHQMAGKNAPLWLKLCNELGDFKKLAQHGQAQHIENHASAAQRILHNNEIDRSSEAFAHWVAHWLIKSCVSTKLAPGNSTIDYAGLRDRLITSILVDRKPLESSCAKTAQAQILEKVHKSSYARILILSHFQHEPRFIFDPCFQRLTHCKNLKNIFQTCALISALEHWQKLAPAQQTFSQTLATYFKLEPKASAKQLFYAALELPYRLQNTKNSQSIPNTALHKDAKITPQESRAAFYYWAYKILEEHPQHAKSINMLTSIVETGQLQTFRDHKILSFLSPMQRLVWNQQVTIEKTGYTPQWRYVNTIDPMIILPASRYAQSCMNVYRDQRSDQFHLGRLLNPLNRQLQMYAGNAFVGRAVLRIMFDWDTTPTLYLDKAYFSDDTQTQRNRTCVLEMLKATQALSRNLDMPMVVNIDTFDTIDSQAWHFLGQQTLKDAPLTYPDYYDAEVRADTRPQRGRLQAGETPKVRGYQNPFHSMAFDLDMTPK